MSETVSKSFSDNVLFYKSFFYSIVSLNKIKTIIKYKNAQNVIYSWISLCQTRLTRNFGEVEICLKFRFKLKLFNLIYHSYLKCRWSIFYLFIFIWLHQKLVSRGGVFPERQQSLNNIVVFGTYVGSI